MNGYEIFYNPLYHSHTCTCLTDSVFKTGWVDYASEWSQPELAAEFEIIRSVRDVCNKALHRARTDKAIRSSSQAEIAIRTSSSQLSSLLSQHISPTNADSAEFTLRDILVVSECSLTDKEFPSSYVAAEEVVCGGEMAQVSVSASASKKSKCPKCWKYRVASSAEGVLCDRCSVIESGVYD